MSARRAFLVDQLSAATHETSVRGLLTGYAQLTPAHRAARQLSAELLDQLNDGLPLCEHLERAAPQRAVWCPGMTTLACPALCFISYLATNISTACDLCNTDVGAMTVLEPAYVSAGPIAIVSAICRTCRHAPATGRPHRPRLAHRLVIDALADRYEEVATS